MAISPSLTNDHILAALADLDGRLIPPHRTSYRYFLIHKGKEYPPKYVLAMAQKHATGEEPAPDAFNAVQAKAYLEKLGFTIETRKKRGSDSEETAIAGAQKTRIFSIYGQLLKWARVFLLDESFTNFRGHHHNKAILFPMERIFEDYVSYCFRRYLKDYDVSFQDNAYHLVERHNGTGRFRLRPDIVLRDRKTNTSIVIDCKWKLVDANDMRTNYRIAQSDMYQLYAYGKKYTKLPCSQLVLIYPKQEHFQKSLPVFEYEEGLELRVVPWDLEKGVMESIATISRDLDSSVNIYN